MNAKEKQEEHERRGFIKASIIFINALLIWLFTYIGGFQLICEYIKGCDDFFGPKIELEISPKENIKVGDEFSVNYSVPKAGYFSLWNRNSKGEIKVMVNTTPVSAENYKKSYTIKPDTVGMEHIILLWSEENRIQLSETYYSSPSIFNSKVKALGDDIKRQEDQVQILP